MVAVNSIPTLQASDFIVPYHLDEAGQPTRTVPTVTSLAVYLGRPAAELRELQYTGLLGEAGPRGFNLDFIAEPLRQPRVPWAASDDPLSTLIAAGSRALIQETLDGVFGEQGLLTSRLNDCLAGHRDIQTELTITGLVLVETMTTVMSPYPVPPEFAKSTRKSCAVVASMLRATSKDQYPLILRGLSARILDVWDSVVERDRIHEVKE